MALKIYKKIRWMNVISKRAAHNFFIIEIVKSLSKSYFNYEKLFVFVFVFRVLFLSSL